MAEEGKEESRKGEGSSTAVDKPIPSKRKRGKEIIPLMRGKGKSTTILLRKPRLLPEGGRKEKGLGLKRLPRNRPYIFFGGEGGRKSVSQSGQENQKKKKSKRGLTKADNRNSRPEPGRMSPFWHLPRGRKKAR